MGNKSLLVRMVMALVAIVLTTVGLATGPADAVPVKPSAVVGGTDLGPNVYLFTPDMSQSDIQATVDGISAKQLTNQFGDDRYALLFAPGTYGSQADPLTFQVGYYTDVMGLGQNPGDVVINGSIDAYNQCDGSCIALNNFWRSMSNLTINVMGGSGCYAGEFWATSQATSMRRLQINNNGSNVTLMDYCTGPSYASGGFIADSAVSGSVINGSQQQYLVRNSQLGGWSNSVWNQVFVGTPGAPPESFGVGSTPQYYTTVAQAPVEREKPYLYQEKGGDLDVFVPSAKTATSGTSWSATTNTRGASLPISSFFVASPSSTVASINAALASGQNLLLTPGIYALASPIVVTNPNTVVLGLGLPTLRPTAGNVAMQVAGVAGVDLSDILFDAGSQNSPTLLDMAASTDTGIVAGNPSGVHDVYFRVGGAHEGKVDTAFELDTSNVVLDNIWSWRADHGTGVGWTENTSTTGLHVRGSDVTAYGLFVEHFQGDEIVWDGARGRVYMLQNEMPYDPPNQAAWNANSDFLGHAALFVRSGATDFHGYGMGSYSNFDQGVEIHASQAFTLAPGTGATVHDVETVFLNGYEKGGIDSVVNGAGGSATAANASTPVVVLDDAAAATDDTSTAVTCGSAAPAGSAQTCKATVVDTTAGVNTPTGMVSFSASGSGSFDATSCTLSDGTCSVHYTPSAFGTGSQTVTASYQGDTGFASGQATATVTITADATATAIRCVAVTKAADRRCQATVTDTTSASRTPTGTVTFTHSGKGSFTGTGSCTLSHGTCSVTFTPGAHSQTITAGYRGATGFTASSKSLTLVVPDRTTTVISCARGTASGKGYRTRCQITVIDAWREVRPTGRVTLRGSTGVGVAHSCALAAGSSRDRSTCSVNVTHPARATLRADYPGTSAARPSSATVTFNKGAAVTG